MTRINTNLKKKGDSITQDHPGKASMRSTRSRASGEIGPPAEISHQREALMARKQDTTCSLDYQSPTAEYVQVTGNKVMSSCLCKDSEGSVSPLPLFVVAVEDGIDDSVHALNIDEADHGSRAAAHFDKASFDHDGRSQFLPKRPGEAEEGEQLGQVLLQLPHHPGVGAVPVGLEGTKRRLRLALAVRLINRVSFRFDRLVVPLPHLL